jgi:hypothetical protein
MRLAASRAAWTAGNKSATKIPMMAITTSSSTRVKPCLCCVALMIQTPLLKTEKQVTVVDVFAG